MKIQTKDSKNTFLKLTKYFIKILLVAAFITLLFKIIIHLSGGTLEISLLKQFGINCFYALILQVVIYEDKNNLGMKE